MKNARNTILLAKRIAEIISSRDLVREIIKKEILKNKNKIINLDFSDIEFVSRSAAHELISLQNEMKNKFFNQKHINFINTNSSVANMLRIVAANIAIPNRRTPILNLEKTDIQTLVKNI